jgi:hypothetical protein
LSHPSRVSRSIVIERRARLSACGDAEIVWMTTF